MTPAQDTDAAFLSTAAHADQRVRAALERLMEQHPDEHAAVISGAMAALVRFYIQERVTRDPALSVRDVNKALFPLVNKTAELLRRPAAA